MPIFCGFRVSLKPRNIRSNEIQNFHYFWGQLWNHDCRNPRSQEVYFNHENWHPRRKILSQYLSFYKSALIMLIMLIGCMWYVHVAGLPLLWNQREKWLLFQVLTKEKWDTTGRSGESTGRSQNISIINCTTFHIRGALSWHSYVIMYLLCIKVYSVVV